MQTSEVCVFIKTREELWKNIRDYICEKASYKNIVDHPDEVKNNY